MRNSYAPGQFNNFDFMNKQSGTHDGLQDEVPEDRNFYAFVVSMEDRSPVGYSKEGFDSHSEAQGFVRSLGSQTDGSGHRLEGFVVPGEQVGEAEGRLNQEISGTDASPYSKEGSDHQETYWTENSSRLFQIIKGVYAENSILDSGIVVDYLMETKRVPENLAHAAVHAFNELAGEVIPRMREAKLTTFLRFYKADPHRQFAARDIAPLTDDRGNTLTYVQATELAHKYGFIPGRDPILDKLIRMGTSNAEASDPTYRTQSQAFR